MRRGDLCVTATVAVLALSILAASAQAATGLEPGVHIDPGSPAAKEYALPLNQARETGAASSSQPSSEGSLFGAGIKPPSSGGPPRTGKGPAPAGGGTQAPAPAGASAPGTASSSGSEAALVQAALRAARAQQATDGGGSLLALIGGGVAVLVLGAFGGTVLRHSRRPASSA
jgi:hypothetical protein